MGREQDSRIKIRIRQMRADTYILGAFAAHEYWPVRHRSPMYFGRDVGQLEWQYQMQKMEGLSQLGIARDAEIHDAGKRPIEWGRVANRIYGKD